MKITVTVPASRAPEYLRQIADQLESGHTWGYDGASTNWNTARDPYDTKEG